MGFSIRLVVFHSLYCIQIIYRYIIKKNINAPLRIKCKKLLFLLSTHVLNYYYRYLNYSIEKSSELLCTYLTYFSNISNNYFLHLNLIFLLK
jgi:hypothetical protein